MEGDEEAIIQIEQLMASDEYEQRVQEFADFNYFVCCICKGTTIDDDDELRARYSSRDDILKGLKDILRTIPRYNKKKSMEHLQIFDCIGLTRVLFLLFRSSVKENKEIAKECIRLFLIDPKTNSGFFLPRSIQNQCACIVLSFCEAFYTTTDDEERQLYYSCRETLISILKSIAFSNRLTYFGIARTSKLIGGLTKIFHETDMKLSRSLNSTYLSPSPLATTELRSLKRIFGEFELFSLHIRSAIDEHVRVKGQSLPLDPNAFEKYPYLNDIYMFYVIFTSSLMKINECLRSLNVAVRDAGGNLKFNIGWSYLLSILKELNNISKLYEDGEELLSGAFRSFPLAVRYLIWHSKKGDDHLWLLKCDSAIDFESRIHLIVTMFPEVKDDNRKLHKMLVDRSLLLTESFEHIGLVEASSLHNGLYVEFKNEAATGHGVLREWLFLVCQALFSPVYSLFAECPEDRHRFFPNPAQVKPQQLMLYAFCGRVIALALMRKVKVGIAFDRVFFLQLAEEKISMEDIQCADPRMYKSCKDILEMDADLVDAGALGLTFVREIKEFGSRKTVELCPGGIDIVVNSKNREQYVHLLIQHIFVKSISAKVAYFARGFGDILCKRRLAKNFFRSIGLKGLDCVLDGSDKPICFKDWKAHVKYEDCKENDEQICWFWKVVEGMSMEQQRELLFFWTSVKYLPVVGFSGLSHPLTICKTSCSDDHLPSSHTCFYRLSLPHYPSLAITQQRLSLICQTHVGCSFGFG